MIHSGGGPTIIDGWTGGEFIGLGYNYLDQDAPYIVGFNGPGYYFIASFHPRYNSTEGYEGRALIHKIDLNDSKWHFAAISYDDHSKIACFFVDGIKVVEKNFSDVSHYQSTGGYPTNYSFGKFGRESVNFTGKIDDVRIYNRALSDAEIVAIYGGCSNTDSDNDGVIDQLDTCPNTPTDSWVNKNGCPATKLYTEEQMNVMVESILTWGDLDGDKKIGLFEAIHALRASSGVTTPAIK